jgi:type IV pilus assembly protein PilB
MVDKGSSATPKFPERRAIPAVTRDAHSLSRKLGLPLVELGSLKIPRAILDLIPSEVALQIHCLPLSLVGNVLRVATANPGDVDSIHLIQFLTDKSVEVEVADAKDLQHALLVHYGSAVAESTFRQLGADQHELPVEHIKALAEQRPVVRLVDEIILGALDQGASDIHIRPGEHDVELIYRVDGQLLPIRRFKRGLLPAVIGRIKIIGGMDITERRVPQDGQTRIRHHGTMVDMRLSIVPTIEGESVVIRLLGTKVVMKSIGELGLSAFDLRRFTEVLDRSHGMVLVTGPTGSGKSTTLYAVLNTIIKRNVNIITIEEPVEYHIPGIEQVPVKADIGMTFAAALRNILRHDPDVIMVGEIRDQETARIAVQSALTGHLMLSTLHTNSAAASITRLIEMGVDDFLIRATLLAIVAQRLVRQNCKACQGPEPTDDLIRAVMGVGADETFSIGHGCDACKNTGVSGRRMAYELLVVTPAVRQSITPRADVDIINSLATNEGMVSLTQHALSLARAGIISLAEAYRTRLS